MTPAIRELLCQECGREYPVWATASALWDAATGASEPTIYYLCMDCFGLRADRLGLTDNRVWYLTRASSFNRDDRIAADLDKLTDPRPGTRVEGEGFCWRFLRCGILTYWQLQDDSKSALMSGTSTQALPTLRALVEGGKATVRLPGEEKEN